MVTLVDTNVLIDVAYATSPWRRWSAQRLIEARDAGPVIVNPIVVAEFAAGFESEAQLNQALSPRRFSKEDLPWEAAFLAGRAFAAYRRSGGEKTSPLPDFYIGAHAQVRGYRLISRDVKRYRTYFPDLDLIAPDTHP